MSGEPTSGPVESRQANPGVGQVDRLKELMQGDVGIRPGESGQKRRGQAEDRRNRLGSEAGESEIEPDQVGLHSTDSTENGREICRPVESPTAAYMKPR